MTVLRDRHLPLFFLLLLALLIPLAARAQTSGQILINYPEIADEGDGLGLSVYFNVTDSTGQVATTADVASARFLTDDGQSYDATVEKPTSPIFIALVLDASGSMGGAAQAMRQAAIQAIQDAPQEARFAVIRFNDKIDTLQDFTDDRNRAINAIGEVKPINLAGTCLYDATFQAIQMMGSQPAGRRAIILFTDGKDETRTGQVCSQHVYDDVVNLANQPQSRVPIHTIGLSGGNSAISAGELGDIAHATGGLSAVGDQAALGGLFGKIMDALKAQFQAHAVIYPTQGQHTAQVQVTLKDNSFPQPGIAVFIAPKNYQRIPTITPTQPTPTPTIVVLKINNVSFDPSVETITLEPEVENEQLVHDYRFEFKNESNLLEGQFPLPAPLQSQVTFPSRTLQSGKTTVTLIGFDADGKIIARSQPVEFTYLGPTATVPPPTTTPEPISATLTSIQYDQPNDKIRLNLNILGQEQIDSLQVNVIDSETNLLTASYPMQPAPIIVLPSTGLIPGGKYDVNVIAQGKNGQILSQSKGDFTYTPPLTPTATAVVVSIAINSINIDQAAETFVIGVQPTNQQSIKHYRLRLTNSDSGLMVGSFQFDTPPYDKLSVPLKGVDSGQYTITLDAQDEAGNTLATFTVQAKYSPPTATPTVTPTPTITPTFTPTPLQGIAALGAQMRANPIIPIIIGGVVVALILLLLILVRGSRRPKTGTGFLQEMTMAQPLPPQGKPSRPSAPQPRSAHPAPMIDDEKTNAVAFGPGAGDPEATNVVPASAMPSARLTIQRTRAAGLVGQTVEITRSPFTLGRRGRDLNFEGDDNVSRAHASINFMNGVFTIIDEASTHGTAVNGNRIPPNVAVPLNGGERIMLGTTTMLIFELESRPQQSGFDPDRTNI